PALPVERTDTPPPPTVQTDVPPPSTEQTGAPTPAPTPSGPRIVFPEPVYDFGTVEQGEQITHLFRFINQGEQDLRIADVKTSCGCTAAIISANVIPPGQEGTISATFETARFIGEKVKNVTVYSNDPLQSVTTLTLQGEITVEIAPEPAQLYLGRPHRSEEVTQTVEVLYDAGKPISITKVENTHPAVRVQTEDLEKGNKKGKKLTVTLKKGAAIGRLNDQITVTTTSQKIPTLTIPVFGSIEGDVLVQPPQVSFGTIRQGESRAREVRIKSRAASPVRVLRVESSAANVVPEVTEVKQGEEYRLTLKTKSDGKPGRIQGEVQVFTDHPEEKMLTIPLYGVVGGA
ncbi:MAG: DUF1573 domain-containing protein, partial [Candidatus Binatia bacterium]